MRRPDHRLRPLRVVLAMVALLLAGTLPAHAQDVPPGGQPPAAPSIAIVPADGGAVRRLPFSDFARSLDVNTEYDMPDGTVRRVEGISLKTLLARMGIQSGAYTMVTAVGESGMEMQVLRPQILSDVSRPPVVWADEQGVLRLLRPQTEADPRGVESAASVDGTLTLTLREGGQLIASPEQVRINQLVSFRVILPPGMDANRVEYEWDMNVDGKMPERNRRPAKSYSYKEAGAYNPSVTLWLDGVRQDDLLFAMVDVTEPPRRSGEDRRARESGNRRGAAPSGRSGETPAGGGGTGGGSGSGTGGGSGSGGPIAHAPAAPAAPAAPPLPETPPAPKPRAKQQRERAPPPEPAGETVTGYLLASADGAPLPADGGAPRASPAARVLADDSKLLQIPMIAWVLAGIAGVVMLGWALESRTTLPYFKP